MGGKYEHIKNIVQENSVSWADDYLNEVAVDDLFGQSAEKLAEAMVAQASLMQNGRKPEVRGQRIRLGGFWHFRK